jgi:uncharacterized membrane protein
MPSEGSQFSADEIGEPRDNLRLTTLTDGAVAISLTLLFLPVADIVRQRDEAEWTTLFTQNNPDISWTISTFIVILVCWRYHHVLFENLRSYDRATLWLNFIWLFCVISLPLLTLATLPDVEDQEQVTGLMEFILQILTLRGDNNTESQNYIVYWTVLTLSFLSLLLIAHRARNPSRGLRNTRESYGLSSGIYLRPTLVSLVAGTVGGFFLEYAHIILWVGILTAIAITQYYERRQSKLPESG